MKNILLFTDTFRDTDDEISLCIISALKHLKKIDFLGVVSNSLPAVERAKGIKSLFHEFGLDIPVAIGSNCATELDQNNYQFDLDYPVKTQDVLPRDVLYDKIDYSKPIDIIIICSCTDAYEFLVSHEKKLHPASTITVMGGVKLIDGMIHPDDSFNYTLDMEAAKKFFGFINILGLKVNFVTRHVAYREHMKKEVFEEIFDNLHPVASSILRRQELALTHLYKQVCLPIGERSKNIPDRLNRQWFLDKICGPDVYPDEVDENNIWEYVKQINLYDPYTVLSCFNPELFLFEEVKKNVFVIGFGENNSIFKNKKDRIFTKQLLKMLLVNSFRFYKTVDTTQQ